MKIKSIIDNKINTNIVNLVTEFKTKLARIFSAITIRVVEDFILLFHLFLFTIGYFTPIVLLYLLLYTSWWPIVLCYSVWFFYDRYNVCKKKRKSGWLRRLRIFNYYREYFPVRLIKTAELPPKDNYLLVLYPHGVLTTSIIANFATEANKVESEVFPEIDMRFVTLNANIYLPILGEYFLALGGCGASEYHISCLLSQKSSTAVALIAGGASEAKLAYPGSVYKIIATRRKGFVRIALQNGASLVPVFSFGENNTYDQFNSKWIPIFPSIIFYLTGIQMLLIRGRGLLQNNCGVLPRRTPINTIVGKPIAVPKVKNPSNELIEKYHKKFFEELMALFEEYKHEYDPAGSEAQLIML